MDRFIKLDAVTSTTLGDLQDQGVDVKSILPMMTVNVWKPKDGGSMDAKVRAVVLGDRERQIEGEEIRATVPDFPHTRMARP